VERLIAGEKISVNTMKYQNDMTTFESADDVLTLLVHPGYLTTERRRWEMKRFFLAAVVFRWKI